MKKDKIISILSILVLLFSTASISVSAADSDSHSHEILSSEKSLIFEDGTSSEIKKRIIMDLSGNGETPNSTKGLTCILFGHKLETGTLITITHRVRATSPRCLRETYDYEICTRCGYSKYTCISSMYIVCCS